MIPMAEEATAQVENKQETQEPQQAERKVARRKKAPTPKKAAGAISAPDILLFGKYDFNIEIRDPSVKNYVNLKPMFYPSTFRSDSKKKFSKANLNIVERLANDIMRGGTGGKIGGRVIRTKGRLQGKKFKVMRIIEDAFDIVQEQTGQNPLKIYINALENAAPIEDTTRVRYGGIISNIPVDVSASRRLDIAIRNISMAAVIGGFGNKRNLTETLANELILAAKNDVNSYAIKRKNEIERMARSAK